MDELEPKRASRRPRRGGFLLLVAMATPLLGGAARAQEDAPPAGNIKMPSYDEPEADDAPEDAPDRDAGDDGG